MTVQRSEANAAAIEADRSAIAQLRSTVHPLVHIVEIYQRNHEATQRILEDFFARQEHGE